VVKWAGARLLVRKAILIYYCVCFDLKLFSHPTQGER